MNEKEAKDLADIFEGIEDSLATVYTLWDYIYRVHTDDEIPSGEIEGCIVRENVNLRYHFNELSTLLKRAIEEFT